MNQNTDPTQQSSETSPYVQTMVKKVEGLRPINYISLAVFFFLLALLLFIIVKHMTRFVAFFVIRKDYQRIKTMTSQVRMERTSTSFSKLSASQKLQAFRQQLAFHTLNFQPLFSVCFGRLKVFKGYLKLPFWISVGLALLGLSVLTALSLALARIHLTLCQENRILNSLSLVCQKQSASKSHTSQIFEFGAIAAILNSLISFGGTYFISRNYHKFLRRMAEDNDTLSDQHSRMLTQVRDLGDSRNVNLTSQREISTLQNMLNNECDSVGTGRSMMAPGSQQQQRDKAQQKLFQINEDEEEEPFSPSKDHYSHIQIEVVPANTSLNKSQANEQRSYIERSQSNNNSALIHIPRNADYESDNNRSLNDPPQFCSQSKNNLEDGYQNQDASSKFNSQSQPCLFQSNRPLKVGLSRPMSQMKTSRPFVHSHSLSDSSTIGAMLGDNTGHSTSQIAINQNLVREGVLTEMDERRHTVEDASKIIMMSELRSKQEWQPKTAVDTNSKELVAFFIAIVAFFLCQGYICYSFLNFTEDGIYFSLSILGLGFFIEGLVVKPVAILVMSIFILKTYAKCIKSPWVQESQQLALLGTIYETYEQPLTMMLPQENAEIYSQIQHQTKNKITVDGSKVHYDMESQPQLFQPQSQSQPDRIIKIGNKSRRNLGEIVLVEDTYFYQQQNIELAKKHEKPKVEGLKVELIQKKKTQKTGELVECSQTMVFNAELELKKSQINKIRNQNAMGEAEEAEEIEEIPMHSQGAEQQRSDGIQGNHNFETPKGAQSILPPTMMLNNNLVTFNDCRDSADGQMKLLKDLVGSVKSESSKGLKYQSLKRYLEQEKENNPPQLQNSTITNGSIKSAEKRQIKTHLRDSLLGSNRKNIYNEIVNQVVSPSDVIEVQAFQVQKEEVYHFTPQYNSLIKKSPLKKEDASLKDQENRQSLGLPDIFTDLNAGPLSSDLIQSKNGKKSKKQSKAKQSKEGTHQRPQGDIKKNDRSPLSTIKENLENKMALLGSGGVQSKNQQVPTEKPNISPFYDFKGKAPQEEQDTMVIGQQNQSKEMNMIKDTDFGKGSSRFDYNPYAEEPPKLTESVNQNLKRFLQPQLTKIKQTQKSGPSSVNKDYQDSQKQSNGTVPSMLSSGAEERKEAVLITKPKINTKKKTLNKNDEGHIVSNETSQAMNLNFDDEIQPNDDQIVRHDTVRSKLFEDNDSSTFRMIYHSKNGAGKPGTKTNRDTFRKVHPDNTTVTNTQDNSNIDFYSNHQVHHTASSSRVFEVGQIHSDLNRKAALKESIIEEAPQHNSSPEVVKNSKAQKAPQTASSQRGPANETQSVQRLNSRADKMRINEDYYDTNEDQKMNLIMKRRPRGETTSNNGRKKNKVMEARESTQSNDSRAEIQSVSSKQQPDEKELQRRAKEESELVQWRIDDQKRKLKSFMKLAKQLKSTADEKKIKGFLEYIKEYQKPLPFNKIKELKQLELMSSPYNQSLIAMIKDEHDIANKGNKSNERKIGSKSTRRINESRQGALNQLAGIYGGGSFASQTSDQREQKDFTDAMERKVIKKRFKTNIGNRSSSSNQTQDATRPSRQVISNTSRQPALILDYSRNDLSECQGHTQSDADVSRLTEIGQVPMLPNQQSVETFQKMPIQPREVDEISEFNNMAEDYE